MEWDLDGNEEEVGDVGEPEEELVVEQQTRSKASAAQPKKEEDMFVLERVQWR
jgi:hypothetical protein